MKYAVISDIHSNLEALSRVLEETDKIGVDEVICLGDIVGYGASPNECVEMLRLRKIESVMGNHDVVACGKKEPVNFNPAARDAVLWTRSKLTDDNAKFLGVLPDAGETGDFLAVHGAISDPDMYILSDYDAVPEFELMEKHSLCFFGHTHVRIYYTLIEDGVRRSFNNEFSVNQEAKYLINPGSVGQPRDRDPRASFLIYDDDERIVKFIRLEYDIESAQRKILEAGLDGKLADRLSFGM